MHESICCNGRCVYLCAYACVVLCLHILESVHAFGILHLHILLTIHTLTHTCCSSTSVREIDVLQVAPLCFHHLILLVHGAVVEVVCQLLLIYAVARIVRAGNTIPSLPPIPPLLSLLLSLPILALAILGGGSSGSGRCSGSCCCGGCSCSSAGEEIFGGKRTMSTAFLALYSALGWALWGYGGDAPQRRDFGDMNTCICVA